MIGIEKAAERLTISLFAIANHTIALYSIFQEVSR